MIRHAGKYACLRGNAAECWELLPALTAVCRQLGPRTWGEQHRLRALEHLTDIHDICTQGPHVLPPVMLKGRSAQRMHFSCITIGCQGIALLGWRRCYNFPGKSHMRWRICFIRQADDPHRIVVL